MFGPHDIKKEYALPGEVARCRTCRQVFTQADVSRTKKRSITLVVMSLLEALAVTLAGINGAPLLVVIALSLIPLLTFWLGAGFLLRKDALIASHAQRIFD